MVWKDHFLWYHQNILRNELQYHCNVGFWHHKTIFESLIMVPCNHFIIQTLVLLKHNAGFWYHQTIFELFTVVLSDHNSGVLEF